LSEKSFETLLGPSLSYANSKGEIVVALKRKGLKYGQLYYLFEVHYDRIETEKLGKFNAVWSSVKSLARQMNIPLYDINEVYPRFEAKAKELEILKSTNIGKTIDVEIDVLDHATETIMKLTIGITVLPKSLPKP